MRIPRIYQPGQYSKGQTIILSEEAGQHIGLVLRMQAGESLILFNGYNQEFNATIVSAQKRKVTVLIQSMQTINRESPCQIHLAQAISKGDRMEFVVQKAVELGVTSITPIITERCVVRLDPERMQKKIAQWQAIAIAACEQSGRNQIPMIHQAQTLDKYLKMCKTALKLILEPTSTNSWREYKEAPTDIALLIGPEGGLSTTEVLSACEYDFQALRLGPRILRTETAAIAAVVLLQAHFGDF